MPISETRPLIGATRCLGIAFAFFTLMVLICAIPGNAKAASAIINDKILHFVAYGFLSCLIYGGLAGRLLNRAVRTVLAIALLGGLDETIQIFMPYRSADLADWEFDMLASLSCVAVPTLLHTLGLAMARRRLNNGQERLL